jgi:hypothetical protein
MDTQLQGDFLIVLTFKVGKQKWDLRWAPFLIFPYLQLYQSVHPILLITKCLQEFS